LLALLAPTATFAAEPRGNAAERDAAAHAYDRALAAFDEGRYGAAAASFLEADAHVPSADALHNALIAARRAGDGALVREAAERALERERTDPTLAAEGRAALAELQTPPATNEPDASGPRAVAATNPTQGDSEVAASAASAAPRTAPPARAAPRAAERAPWVAPVFYAGVATTAVLVGLTIWSGLDTLSAKSRLPGTLEETEAVRARAHRTDALLAGSVLAGAMTTYVGLRWFRGLPTRPAPAATVDRRGAMLLVNGSF
jgi:hypothetical protein